MGNVKEKRLLPGRGLGDEIGREVGDQIGLVRAFGRQGERAAVAVELRVADLLEVVSRPGVPRTAEESIDVPSDHGRIMPVVRRDHVEPSHGARRVAGPLE